METEKNPVTINIPAPEKSSRILAVCTLLFLIPKMILAIPHLIAMWVLGILAFFASVFAQVAVLVSGKYPARVHHFVVGTLRWQVRVNAYLLGLRDEYPPFTLED